MSNMFGGHPVDDPFFSRPCGSSFGSGMSRSGDPVHVSKSGLVIEELDNDAKQEGEEESNVNRAGEGKDKYNENAWANKNPLVEHPEDQSYGHSKGKSQGREVSYRTDHGIAERTQPEMRSMSFHKVAYGGINGVYYTASTTRRTGSDGVVLEESKLADKTAGEATHIVSRGIHDKGHSFTRKLNSDGKVDSMQTLHNLEEDELANFEQSWKGSADRHLPGWNYGFDLLQNTGTGSGVGNWPGLGLPSRDSFGCFGGVGHDQNGKRHSSGERPKKVVTIDIE